MTLRLGEAAANAEAEAVAALLSGGYLRLYAGPRPANADTPGGPPLVELRFGAGPAPVAKAGVVALHPPAPGIAALTGRATFYCAVAADGTTVAFDGSVGEAEEGWLLGLVDELEFLEAA